MRRSVSVSRADGVAEIAAMSDPINRETEDLANSVMDDLTDEEAGFSAQGDNRWKSI